MRTMSGFNASRKLRTCRAAAGEKCRTPKTGASSLPMRLLLLFLRRERRLPQELSARRVERLPLLAALLHDVLEVLGPGRHVLGVLLQHRRVHPGGDVAVLHLAAPEVTGERHPRPDDA